MLACPPAARATTLHSGQREKTWPASHVPSQRYGGPNGFPFAQRPSNMGFAQYQSLLNRAPVVFRAVAKPEVPGHCVSGNFEDFMQEPRYLEYGYRIHPRCSLHIPYEAGFSLSMWRKCETGSVLVETQRSCTWYARPRAEMRQSGASGVRI